MVLRPLAEARNKVSNRVLAQEVVPGGPGGRGIAVEESAEGRRGANGGEAVSAEEPVERQGEPPPFR